MAYDVGTDTAVWFVATLPQAQRQGRATPDPPPTAARRRASAARRPPASRPARGPPLYERLGFRTVGELHLYEQPLMLTAPEPGAPRRPLLPALRAAGHDRLPALDHVPALRLRRLLQPEARRRRDPGHARRTGSSCSGAATTPARTCGRSPAASSTSASRSRRPPTARRTRSSTSRSSSAPLVGVYSRAEERIVLIVYAATTPDRPRTTDEAIEVQAFDRTDSPGTSSPSGPPATRSATSSDRFTRSRDRTHDGRPSRAPRAR